MVEHAETFLSLFAVDMDAALEVQPPDTWDSFPLFQLLNDFLRTDCMYLLGLFGKWGTEELTAKTSLCQAGYRPGIALSSYIITENKKTNQHQCLGIPFLSKYFVAGKHPLRSTQEP